MPLFVVSSLTGFQVIANANSPQEAVSFAQAVVGAGAQARAATLQDAETIPLLGSVTQGDNRPAMQADPNFVQSMGLGGVTQAFDSPPADVGPGPGPFASGGRVPAYDSEVQADFDESAYLGGLRNAGRDPYGAFGSYLRGRRAPTVATFKFNELLGQSNPRGLQGYTEDRAGGNSGQGLNAEALSTFQRLAASRAGGVNASQPSFTQDLRDQLYNAKTGDQGGALRGQALQLGLAGARSKVSPYFASQAYDQNRISQDFEDQLYKNTGGGGNQGIDLVDFLKRYFNF